MARQRQPKVRPSPLRPRIGAVQSYNGAHSLQQIGIDRSRKVSPHRVFLNPIAPVQPRSTGFAPPMASRKLSLFDLLHVISPVPQRLTLLRPAKPHLFLSSLKNGALPGTYLAFVTKREEGGSRKPSPTVSWHCPAPTLVAPAFPHHTVFPLNATTDHPGLSSCF